MNNAIIYTRVATEAQKNQNSSIQNQEILAKKYCELKQYNVISIYKEVYSAKTFNRPEWGKIMAFIKANKGLVNKVVFLKWDRFSRNQFEAIATIKYLEKLNVDVECIEQPLDMENPDNILLLNIYLSIPEIENKKNSIRTKVCMRQAALNGCWLGTRPFGYDKDWETKETETVKRKNATLKPNEINASIVREIFRLYTVDFLSAESIKKKIKIEFGHGMSKQGVLDILKNVCYIGKVKVLANKKEPEQIVNGYHPPIVSDELFYDAQMLLKEKTRKHIRKDNKEDFPLKSIIKCSICNRSYTASVTTKNNGANKYPYYHCSTTKGHDRYSSTLVHDTFGELLKEFNVKEEINNLYQKVLIDTINEHNSAIIKEKKSIESEIASLDIRIKKTEDKFADDVSKDNATFTNMLKRYNDAKNELVMKHATLKAEATPRDSDIMYLIELFNSFDVLYKKSDYTLKTKLVGSIFPKPIYFFKNHFRTEEVSPLLELLILNTNKLERLKIETSHLKNGSSSNAPPV